MYTTVLIQLVINKRVVVIEQAIKTIWKLDGKMDATPPWKSGKYCTKGNTALMGTIKKCKIAFPDKSHESI